MKKITLPNGLRILFDYVDWARSCTVSVCIASGSRYESGAALGAAHFIEHMLFKGTKTRSAFDISKQMDEIGGALNAYTTKEYTCIYARTLTDHIEKAVDIIGDMLNNSKIDRDDLELEKSVIKEEIAMYEDSAEDLCFDVFYENAWRTSTLGNNILGTRASVSGMTTDIIRKQLADFYVPERMTIAFCGKFDEERVHEQCEKYFGSLKNTGNLLMTEPADYHQTDTFIRKEFEQNQIVLGMNGLPREDKRTYALNLATGILGGASSSRLFQRIREELGLVYSIDAFNANYINAGLVGISMALAPKAEKKAISETLKIINGFSDSISNDELSRMKEQMAASVVMGLESTASRSANMARNELLYNKVESEDEIVEKIRRVSRDEVRAVAKEIFDLCNLSVCAVGKGRDAGHYRRIIDAAEV